VDRTAKGMTLHTVETIVVGDGQAGWPSDDSQGCRDGVRPRRVERGRGRRTVAQPHGGQSLRLINSHRMGGCRLVQ